MKIIDTNFNILTGEETVTEREESADETKSRLDNAKETAAAQAAAAAKATEKAALLTKLGITADEAKLLLG